MSEQPKQNTDRSEREMNMKILIIRLCRRLGRRAPVDDEESKKLIKQACDYLQQSGTNKITDILR